jgi:glycerophosphoryl diester phosphodiesterase
VAPENSLEAMLAALTVAGCDGLEFDLRNSLDGVPVLLHDEDLARVQKVPVKCATLTAAELAGHGIPTFKEVLDAVDCDVFLDVELKERVDGAIDLLELERGRVADDGTPELRSAVVSSFEPEILRWLATERPTWPRWLNAYDLSARTLSAAVELGCEAVSVEWHAIDGPAVARARESGLGVAAWTVRAAGDYARLESLGLRAICAEASALGA